MLFETDNKLKRYAIYFHIVYGGVSLHTEKTIRHAKSKEDAMSDFDKDMMFWYEIDDVVPLDKGDKVVIAPAECRYCGKEILTTDELDTRGGKIAHADCSDYDDNSA
jgi:formylmethanofuran dehydrogenase subunit E